MYRKKQDNVDDPPVIPSPTSPTEIIEDQENQSIRKVLKNYSYQKNWEKSFNWLYYNIQKGGAFCKKWNITILNDKQPMLKTSDRDGGTLYLVPELCSITEFNDTIGKKHLVKELSQYTNYGPNKTINKYNQFLSKLQYTQKFSEALNSWHLSLSRKLIRISGRILPPANLKCRNHIIPVGDQGNWTDQLKLLKMLKTPYVENWVVLAPSKYFSIVKQFVYNLMLIAKTMAFTLPEPEIVQINDESQISYMNHLDEIVNRNINFILFVIKSRNSDIYNGINRKLCLEASVPFHLLSLKQVSNNDLSTYAKTAIRINCKLGGVPWSVADIADENIMVVGLDMYRDSLNKHKYFCAVVVSINNCNMRYSSYVKLLCKKDISEFYVSCIVDALSKYKDLNRKLPRGVLIYRDGLKYEDESFKKTCMSEINLMLAKCLEFYRGCMVPFAYILVRKSNETKFFIHNDSLNYRNPLPGTIVDSDITNPNILDFFLISHTVKSGSVSPTYYCILFNSIPQFLIDELHMITYFLTHVYYKSSHTIRVPAPCQLAYDLAYFSANTLKSTEKILLHSYPFFF
ncbi:piwi-like protein Siwi [Metopolophium dirhodum]|uniref:piwi-like protein Siwi n=1 Tax=Metopolophium dirhodum TaxID=44670 RepID=UPI00299054BB|nr:piwi-like protein Siwi [Metopolophium dirhodum]